MDADAQLQNAYKEWRRLAEAEGEGIRSGNWALVADCQQALLQLQTAITARVQEARDEWVLRNADLASKEEVFRGMVGDLIEIEERNKAALDAARKTALTVFGELEQATRTLQQVHSRYASPNKSGWTSFS